VSFGRKKARKRRAREGNEEETKTV